MTLDNQTTVDRDQALAAFCADGCQVCIRARQEQKGLPFWFVKNIAGSVCPACQSYERVYGRKAHEPAPGNVEKGNV